MLPFPVHLICCSKCLNRMFTVCSNGCLSCQLLFLSHLFLFASPALSCASHQLFTVSPVSCLSHLLFLVHLTSCLLSHLFPGCLACSYLCISPVVYCLTCFMDVSPAVFCMSHQLFLYVLPISCRSHLTSHLFPVYLLFLVCPTCFMCLMSFPVGFTCSRYCI